MLDLGKDRSNTVNYNNHHSSILVVDDEHDIVNLVKESLELNGQQVCGFIDATPTLDHLKSDSKDNHCIVISDIRMPGMNGYEFVKQVKKINPKVKVILMTAFEINDNEFHNLLPDIKVEFGIPTFCLINSLQTSSDMMFM